MQAARRRVSDEGYVFKKGRSRSKLYGNPQAEAAPKRPKYSEDMREERMATIDEELRDISRIMHFKERRVMQAEAGKKYTICEQITEELMDLKSKKHELEVERRSFINKARRAKCRQRRLQRKEEVESSDVETEGPSSSRCSTSRSVTPICSQPPAQTALSPSPNTNIDDSPFSATACETSLCDLAASVSPSSDKEDPHF